MPGFYLPWHDGRRADHPPNQGARTCCSYLTPFDLRAAVDAAVVGQVTAWRCDRSAGAALCCSTGMHLFVGSLGGYQPVKPCGVCCGFLACKLGLVLCVGPQTAAAWRVGGDIVSRRVWGDGIRGQGPVWGTIREYLGVSEVLLVGGLLLQPCLCQCTSAFEAPCKMGMVTVRGSPTVLSVARGGCQPLWCKKSGSGGTPCSCYRWRLGGGPASCCCDIHNPDWSGDNLQGWKEGKSTHVCVHDRDQQGYGVSSS